MIRHLFLDADDTLLDFHRSEHAALKETFSQCGIAPTEALLKRYSEINLQYWKELEQQLVTRDQLKVRRFEDLMQEFRLSASPQVLSDLYEEELSKVAFLMDGCMELLQTLKSEGKYHLHIASNGTRHIQLNRLLISGITPYMDHIFLSQDIGYDKPHIGFFEACFRAIPQASPAECLIVGDSLTSDICGGRDAGMHTVWFNPKALPSSRTDILPDYEIRSLLELPTLLKRI